MASITPQTGLLGQLVQWKKVEKQYNEIITNFNETIQNEKNNPESREDLEKRIDSWQKLQQAAIGNLNAIKGWQNSLLIKYYTEGGDLEQLPEAYSLDLAKMLESQHTESKK